MLTVPVPPQPLWPRARRSAGRVGPGLMLAAVIAMAARFVSSHYGGPLMLYALLFGVAFNHLAAEPRTAPGIDFATRTVLRIGVALLGMSITLGEVAGLGLSTLALVCAGVTATLVCGWFLGRLLRLDSDHAILSAGAVAICGASAALAIAAVLPARPGREFNTLLTVAAVTAISTVAMIVYPMIAHALSFDDRAAGIFLGATIHDVAQAVGAGHLVSDSAGGIAAIVKLMRVATLVPVVLVITWLFRGAGPATGARRPLVPWFLAGFIALLLLNSVGGVSPIAAAGMRELSSACIITAVAALGVRTSMRELLAVGPRPVLAMAAQTVFLALFVLAWLLLGRAAD